ncbi:MAG: hypothetical protein AB7V22_03620 [Kiritimatiellia bacterium]
MKKGLILLLSAMILLGSLAPASAIPYISRDQLINYTANGAYFWAMIWDYTNGFRESATPGAVNYDYWLGYDLNTYGEVHVAYLYNWATGRYIEAQALRNVWL